MLIGQPTTWNVQVVLLGFLQVKKQWMDDSEVHSVQHFMFMFVYILYMFFSYSKLLCHPMLLSWQNVCSCFLCQKQTSLRFSVGILIKEKHMVFRFWIDLNPLLFRGFVKRRLSLLVCIYMYIFMALSFRLLVAFWHKATTTQNILWLIEIIARYWVKIKWS
jgi:hypothetical protein